MYPALIYFSGFAITYYGLRYWCKKEERTFKWDDFWMCLVLGVFSWIGFMVVIILAIAFAIKKNMPPKPPKWL